MGSDEFHIATPVNARSKGISHMGIRRNALLIVPLLLDACNAAGSGQSSTTGNGLIGSWASSAPVLVVAVASCDLCFDASNPRPDHLVCTTTLPTASEQFHVTLTTTPGSDAGN